MKNQVALVTGGAGYIGGAIIDKLAENGAKIAFFDINAEACEKKIVELRNRGVDCESYVVDLTDYTAVCKQVEAVISKFGKIDILVPCAGGSARKEIRRFAEQKIDVLHRVIDMNLYGTLHVLHAVVPYMIKANRGKIVCIGSLVGMGCVPGCLDYGCAKAGVISMVRSLAVELGPYNINVNSVSPGKVPRPDEVPTDVYSFTKRFQVINHMLTGRDVAEVVAFLASSAADAITGQNYPVCGGRSVGLRGDY